ncbi:MAG: hypothetical protein OET44_16190 [Gammaproteobacteria bacterium]|nr:hypothetical protein [Gammaproteobacteria bacterium]
MSLRRRCYISRNPPGWIPVILVAQFLSMSAAAQTHPVKVWGELGYDFRFEDFEQQGDLTEHVGVARINASTFIYEPWIATVDGGLGLNARAASGDRAGSDSDQILGDGILRLFPLSRFPFELFALRSDTRTDTDIAGTDVLVTSYGFQQSYTSESGASSRLRYERSETENNQFSEARGNVSQEDVSDLWQLALHRNFGVHGLNFESNLNRVDSIDRGESTETAFSFLRHTYRPGPTMSAEDLLTYSKTTYERVTQDLVQDFLQLNSFARWRPARDSNLRTSTTLRVLGRDNTSGDEGSSLESGTGTVGLTYALSARSFVSASAGGTVLENEGARENSSFQRGSVNYTTQIYPLLGFDSSYFGQFSAENNDESDSDAVQTLGANLGYDLTRLWRTGDTSSLQFTTGQSAVGQSAAIARSTEGLESHTLLTSAALNWNQRGTSVSSMVGASIRDSRTDASGEGSELLEGNFQLANLQASLNQNYGAHASLSGNMTLQATRNDRAILENGPATGDGEWLPTSSIDITYYHRRAFDVPRLVFRSNLRFISDSYFAGLGEVRDPDGRDDKLWENRLDYSIGRILLRMTARVAEVRGEDQALVFFQLRRLFGDI